MKKIKFVIGSIVGMTGMALLPLGTLVHADDQTVTEKTEVHASVIKELKWAVVIPSEIVLDEKEPSRLLETKLAPDSLLEKNSYVSVKISGDENFYKNGQKVLPLMDEMGNPDPDEAETLLVSPQSEEVIHFHNGGTIAELTADHPVRTTEFMLANVGNKGRFAGEYSTNLTFLIDYK
ncbi:hypothetical protein EQG49_04100 [Periweissella cryptocerci]|uniref:Fimbrial assembly protein n=1 Tax=Periweissella cryptocerci TaxID=2506420 RepID=A0A4P6YSK7_9LACO|nr:hypothetical protein [Periweissella cryptocerci]QBO35699.1 hypothetical protein EQG49_04100 [Periweissella cryptocerci]